MPPPLSIADRIVFSGLIVLSAAIPAPLGGHRPLYLSIAMTAIGLSALIFFFFSRLDEEKRLVLESGRTPLILFCLFALWALLQLVPAPSALRHPLWNEASEALQRPLWGSVSVNPAAGLRSLFQIVAAAAIFWLAAHYGAVRRRGRMLIDAVGFIIAVYAGVGILLLHAETPSLLFHAKTAYRDDLTSTFVNRNHFASYAGMGAIVLFHRIFEQWHRIRLRSADRREAPAHGLNRAAPGLCLRMLGFLIAVAALIETHSRAGVFCTIVAMLFAVAALSWRAESKAWRLAPAATLILGVAALAAIGGETAAERLSGIGGDFERRLTINQIAMRAAYDHLWLGSGLGTFADIFPIYRDARLAGYEIYSAAHNAYTETLLELGIIGAAALGGAIATILASLARAARRRRFSYSVPIQGLALSVLFWGHAGFDFSLDIPAVSFTYAALLGACWGHGLGRRERRRPSRNRPSDEENKADERLSEPPASDSRNRLAKA